MTENNVFDLNEFIQILPTFGSSLVVTLLLAGLGIILGLGLGIIAGIGRSFGGRFISRICAVYIEIVRGIPLIVQILMWNFVIPFIFKALFNVEMFSSIDGFMNGLLGPVIGSGHNFKMAAPIAIGVNSGAYQAEILRAGINSLPVGQTEAALSLGMKKSQAIRHVILPQAFRMVVPPLINEFIIVIKDTSLAFAIGVLEISAYTNQLIVGGTAVIQAFLMSALLYFVMCYSLSLVSKWIEKKYAIAGLGVKKRRALL
ncbi:MAG: amino acid ABC transporter permease [Promethearchaeota archaeon]